VDIGRVSALENFRFVRASFSRFYLGADTSHFTGLEFYIVAQLHRAGMGLKTKRKDLNCTGPARICLGILFYAGCFDYMYGVFTNGYYGGGNYVGIFIPVYSLNGAKLDHRGRVRVMVILVE
jgi:hypothetical protein